MTLSARAMHAAGIAVAVADTGAGIAPDHLARIFEPFQHVNASVSRARSRVGSQSNRLGGAYGSP